MAHFKYVADGFTTDAGLLLSDFILANSLDFSVFAELWKSRNFSLVYMGRSSKAELAEFTREIFGLSARYLTAETSVNARVGAVYLLYALFRNQILDPPLRIRMVREQLEVMASLRRDGHRTLRYVVDYLCEHGTDWVACPTLMGPMVPANRARPDRRGDPVAMAALKSNLTETAEVLQDLVAASADYLESKVTAEVDAGFTGDSCRRLGEFASRLQDLVKGDPGGGSCRRPKRADDVRRLKAKAMKAGRSDEDSDRGYGSYVPKRRGPKPAGRKDDKTDLQAGSLTKAEVLGKFNKRKKPKAFKYDGKYWADDAEAVSQDAAEVPYWYKMDTVVGTDSSESEDVDSPKPVESVDEPVEL